MQTAYGVFMSFPLGTEYISRWRSSFSCRVKWISALSSRPIRSTMSLGTRKYKELLRRIGRIDRVILWFTPLRYFAVTWIILSDTNL